MLSGDEKAYTDKQVPPTVCLIVSPESPGSFTGLMTQMTMELWMGAVLSLAGMELIFLL